MSGEENPHSRSGARGFPAILGPLLNSRQACLSLLVVGAGLLVAHGLGRGWHCPTHRMTGVPCPGCGMTRAVASLLRGDVTAAVRCNPFVIPGAVAAVFVTLAGVGPRRLGAGLADWATGVEKRTGITLFVLVAFMVFGVGRALWFLWAR